MVTMLFDPGRWARHLHASCQSGSTQNWWAFALGRGISVVGARVLAALRHSALPRQWPRAPQLRSEVTARQSDRPVVCHQLAMRTGGLISWFHTGYWVSADRHSDFTWTCVPIMETAHVQDKSSSYTWNTKEPGELMTGTGVLAD